MWIRRWYITTFGTKEQLFAGGSSHSRSTRWTSSARCADVPVEELGYKLPSMLLPLWDSEIGAAFIATLRSILAGVGGQLVSQRSSRTWIAVEVGTRVDDPPGSGIIRIQFVASQLVGVVMARYILELEAVCIASPLSRLRTPIAPKPAALPHWRLAGVARRHELGNARRR